MSETHPIPIPDGLSESELLAWVEGERLPREREMAVARALDVNPALARRLGAMREDRAALRSLPEEHAPDGLLESAQALLEPALERDMLLNMERGHRGNPPVSIVRPARPSLLESVFGDRVGRRFAAAAAVLLLVGGATWTLTNILSRPAPVLERGPDLAMTDPPQAPAAKVEQAEPTPTAPELALGGGPVVSTNPADEIVELPPKTLAADAAPQTMDLATAVALARENRLVIRVRGAPGAPARVDAVGERARRESWAWRVQAQAPSELVQALQPTQMVTPWAPMPPSPFALGSIDLNRFIGPLEPPVAPALAVPPPQPRPVYVVETRLDEGSLRAVLGAMAAAGEHASFAQAAEPLPTPPPSISTQTALWWTQPPACWAPWVSIPVVLEPAR